MIKVNYNINGKILGFYPDGIEYSNIPTPYIEITEQEYQEAFLNQDKFKIIDKKLTDISQNSDYILQQKIYENTQKINNFKEEINKIEQAQHRTIREVLLYDTQEAKARLEEQENKILEIRTKMQNIQL